MILDKLDNYRTLFRIVHSSSQFHQVYLLYRRKLLCQVIFRDIAWRTKVFALSEILPSKSPPGDKHLDFAMLMKAFRQTLTSMGLQQKSKLQKPRLAVEECVAVLRYKRLITPRAVSMTIVPKSSNKLDMTLHDHDLIFIGGVEGMENRMIILRYPGHVDEWQWKVM